METPLIYTEQYERALDQAYPNVLHFAALRSAPNDSRYKWVNTDTIKIPHITTTGRVDADRDTVAQAQRNYSNAWETKTLKNFRKWSTLVHPMDIDETNMTTTIGNITRVFNEEQKFPEMDSYLISKLYHEWTTTVNDGATGEDYKARTADKTVLSTSNVLDTFDKLMMNMDNARVPATGRVLYVTAEVNKMIKDAEGLTRTFSVQNGSATIDRRVSRLDEVKIHVVPKSLMQTSYVFTTGVAPDPEADQINMFLVHPSAVITPEKYTFVRLDPPSAGSEGKYIYYEEAYGDAFILNYKADALQFNITPHEAP